MQAVGERRRDATDVPDAVTQNGIGQQRDAVDLDEGGGVADVREAVGSQLRFPRSRP
jgi:hypothetical protein